LTLLVLQGKTDITASIQEDFALLYDTLWLASRPKMTLRIKNLGELFLWSTILKTQPGLFCVLSSLSIVKAMASKYIPRLFFWFEFEEVLFGLC
jgi:hypothetical protein